MLSNNFTDLKSEWTKKYGVQFTKEGLILPFPAKEIIDQKIAKTLFDVKKQILTASATDKYIIYLPGSYDLIHIGHVSFIEQSINFSIKNIKQSNPKVIRKDLFIVALADSDKLIKEVKKYKHVSLGGKETFWRPVERGFNNQDRHPRLDTLASLPVDCVGFLPSPLDNPNSLSKPPGLDKEYISSLIDKLSLNPLVKKMVADAINNYLGFCKKFSCGLKVDCDNPDFIIFWQLYLTLLINDPQTSKSQETPKPFEKGKITRVISVHDKQYAEIVKAIMTIAKVAVAEINDKLLTSTSKLLNEYGCQKLLNSKTTALRRKI